MYLQKEKIKKVLIFYCFPTIIWATKREKWGGVLPARTGDDEAEE